MHNYRCNRGSLLAAGDRLFPVIKSIADRISGKTAQSTQLTALQQKVQLIEHELTDIRTRQLSLEDSQKFQQQLTNPPKQS